MKIRDLDFRPLIFFEKKSKNIKKDVDKHNQTGGLKNDIQTGYH
jgi:hypothetical protein